jgi:hypothetical protein
VNTDAVQIIPDVAKARRDALEEAARAVERVHLKCEFYPVGRSRGVPMLAPRDAKDQIATAIRALAT